MIWHTPEKLIIMALCAQQNDCNQGPPVLRTKQLLWPPLNKKITVFLGLLPRPFLRTHLHRWIMPINSHMGMKAAPATTPPQSSVVYQLFLAPMLQPPIDQFFSKWHFSAIESARRIQALCSNGHSNIYFNFLI